VTLRVEPATADVLAERAAWRYPPPYDFYDDDGVPPKNPEWFYGVHDEDGELVGFYVFAARGEAVFYGLGLRPDLTGRGLGQEFVDTGIAFARSTLCAGRIVLDVAAFNERALKVYERAGFRRTGSHLRTFDRWGVIEFIDMELPE
jgi:[ribosomal protein S18]-alanine N-acetyltransferase